MSAALFRKRVLIGLYVTGAASVLIFLYLLVFGKPVEPVDSSEADSWSRSAVGHRAFVELLKRLDVPVTVSRFSSGERAGDRAVLVLAGPRVWSKKSSAMQKLTSMLDQAEDVLLVLPKWRVEADPDHRGWVRRVDLIFETEVENVLDAVGTEARAVRPTRTPRQWTSELTEGGPTVARPQLLSRSTDLVPLVACEDGVLVAERVSEERHLVILSDPDVLANHGIGRGDNAVLAVALIERLRGGDRPVVVDEVLHGHEAAPSIWDELLRYPLSVATAQLAVALILLLWATLGRFGAPVEESGGLAAGKGILIENTTELLLYGGYTRESLRRYFQAAMRRVAEALHAPPGRRGRDLEKWLTGLARRRGTRSTPGELRDGVARVRSEKATLTVARKIHDFVEEILDGSGERRSRG